MKAKRERNEGKKKEEQNRRTVGRKGPGRRGERRASFVPGTTYWKGLELQTVTAGKFIVLKPMESETLTSQLR